MLDPNPAFEEIFEKYCETPATDPRWLTNHANLDDLVGLA
jgi:hypothetical protein